MDRIDNIPEEKSHKLTREDRVKGGKSKSPLKKVSAHLNTRKNCSRKCPIYPCSLVRYTISEKGEKKLCLLNTLNPAVKKKVIQSSLGTRDAAVDDLLDDLRDMEEKLTKFEGLCEPENRKDIREVMDMRNSIAQTKQKIMKFVHGEKLLTRVEGDAEITIKFQAPDWGKKPDKG